MSSRCRRFGNVEVVPVKPIDALFISEGDTLPKMIKLNGDSPADRYLRDVYRFDRVSPVERMIRTIKNLQELPELEETKESDTYTFNEKVKVTVLENEDDSSLTAILSFDGEKFNFQLNDPILELEVVLAIAKKIAMAS